MATRVPLAVVEPIADEPTVRQDLESVIRVILADDREAMLASLRLALDGDRDIDVVAEARDVATLLAHVKTLLRRLHRQVPETEIVALSSLDDPVFAKKMLDAGARGFVVRGDADVELPLAVRDAAGGERYVSPSVGRSLGVLEDAPPVTRLTSRELEVLRLIALGYTSVEVAAKLKLSPRTIETHRARIQHKLGIDNRAQLVAYALLHGLVANARA
jgi:two-component system response regulator NreC